VRGGQPGGAAKQLKRRRDGTLESLAPCGVVTIEAGERIVAVTCGGGGYGPPQERDRARVAEDVREGWITDARATEVYGWSTDQPTALPTSVTARREKDKDERSGN
jgi:N-methylhydantoinase B